MLRTVVVLLLLLQAVASVRAQDAGISRVRYILNGFPAQDRIADVGPNPEFYFFMGLIDQPADRLLSYDFDAHTLTIRPLNNLAAVGSTPGVAPSFQSLVVPFHSVDLVRNVGFSGPLATGWQLVDGVFSLPFNFEISSEAVMPEIVFSFTTRLPVDEPSTVALFLVSIGRLARAVRRRTLL